MANSYDKPGHVQTFVAPSGGVVSGGFYVHGTLVVKAMTTRAVGENYEGEISGVHQVTKVGSEAWTHGALVYWDAGNTRFTTSSSGNTLAGVAAGAVGSGSGETTGYVLLNKLPGASQ